MRVSVGVGSYYIRFHKYMLKDTNYENAGADGLANVNRTIQY